MATPTPTTSPPNPPHLPPEIRAHILTQALTLPPPTTNLTTRWHKRDILPDIPTITDATNTLDVDIAHVIKKNVMPRLYADLFLIEQWFCANCRPPNECPSTGRFARMKPYKVEEIQRMVPAWEVVCRREMVWEVIAGLRVALKRLEEGAVKVEEGYSGVKRRMSEVVFVEWVERAECEREVAVAED